MDSPQEEFPRLTEMDSPDAQFTQEVARLHQITVYARWLFVSLLWLTVGIFSLWSLRYPISLIREYFTWSAVRYGLAFNPLPATGLALGVGMTLAVLFWQSRNILIGLPQQDRKYLEHQVQRIRQQGPSHPLWKFICQKD